MIYLYKYVFKGYNLMDILIMPQYKKIIIKLPNLIYYNELA